MTSLMTSLMASLMTSLMTRDSRRSYDGGPLQRSMVMQCAARTARARTRALEGSKL